MDEFMRKGNRAALFFLIAGVIFLLLGSLLGAGFSYMVESPYWKWGRLFDWGTAKEESFEFSPAQLTRLKIEMGNGQVHIVESEGSQVVVRLRQKREEIVVGQDKDLLEIKMISKEFWNNSDSKVTLELPKGIRFEQISIENESGKTEIETTVMSNQAVISVGEGMLHAKSLVAGSFYGQVGAGEMNLEETVTDTIEAVCETGNLVFRGEIHTRARIECDSGTVKLELGGTARDYNYKLRCGNGSIRIGEAEFHWNEKLQKISNGSEKSLRLECQTGKISADFN